MLSTYYDERARIWLEATLGPQPATPPLQTQLSQFDERWQRTTWTEAALPSVAVGDAVALAKAMLAKYQ